jgi:hypothetical protein
MQQVMYGRSSVPRQSKDMDRFTLYAACSMHSGNSIYERKTCSQFVLVLLSSGAALQAAPGAGAMRYAPTAATGAGAPLPPPRAGAYASSSLLPGKEPYGGAGGWYGVAPPYATSGIPAAPLALAASRLPGAGGAPATYALPPARGGIPMQPAAYPSIGGAAGIAAGYPAAAAAPAQPVAPGCYPGGSLAGALTLPPGAARTLQPPQVPQQHQQTAPSTQPPRLYAAPANGAGAGAGVGLIDGGGSPAGGGRQPFAPKLSGGAAGDQPRFGRRASPGQFHCALAGWVWCSAFILSHSMSSLHCPKYD